MNSTLAKKPKLAGFRIFCCLLLNLCSLFVLLQSQLFIGKTYENPDRSLRHPNFCSWFRLNPILFKTGIHRDFTRFHGEFLKLVTPKSSKFDYFRIDIPWFSRGISPLKPPFKDVYPTKTTIFSATAGKIWWMLPRGSWILRRKSWSDSHGNHGPNRPEKRGGGPYRMGAPQI